MKNIVLLIVSTWIASIQVFAQSTHITPNDTQEWVMYKNYHSIFLLYKNKALLSSVLANEATVHRTLASKKQNLAQDVDCKDLSCFVHKFKWSESEEKLLIDAIVQAYSSDPTLRNIVDQSLQNSYKYGNSDTMRGEDYLRKALVQDFAAINHSIDVYAAGKTPNYPQIDSISFDVSNQQYLSTLKDVRQDILKDLNEPIDGLFLPLLSGLRFLEINERWDAAQLEPMSEGVNAAAIERIKTTNWANYPYASLLVLGAGPSQYHQPISPGGILRCRMAARVYKSGLAPFIIVSGGRVHPYKTPYIEAVEMKKYLIDVHGIPADAIIVEPHARHTTTNMRNAARLLLQYGFPTDKLSIVGSSINHINTVEKMDARCIKELGYLPYSLGKRISDVLLEFSPSKEALRIDWDEPLDP